MALLVHLVSQRADEGSLAWSRKGIPFARVRHLGLRPGIGCSWKDSGLKGTRTKNKNSREGHSLTEFLCRRSRRDHFFLPRWCLQSVGHCAALQARPTSEMPKREGAPTLGRVSQRPNGEKLPGGQCAKLQLPDIQAEIQYRTTHCDVDSSGT